MNKVDPLIRKLVKELKLKKKMRKTMALGAIAKKRRLALHMTLSEVAENICSVSYLSKIESNQIVPNPKCLELLMERIKMPSWEIYLLECGDDLLDEVLIDYYNYDFVKIAEEFEKMKDIPDNQIADAIKMLYHVLTGNLKEAGNIYSDNYKLISSMSPMVTKVFSIAACDYLTKIKEYQDAINLIYVVKNVYEDKITDYLIKEIEFRFYIDTMNPLSASGLYNELLRKSMENFNIKRILDLKINYSLLCMLEKNYSEAIAILDNLNEYNPEIYREKINYIYGVCYYGLGENIKASIYFDKLQKSSMYDKLSFKYKYSLSHEKDKIHSELYSLKKNQRTFDMEYALTGGNLEKIRDLFSSSLYEKTFASSNYYERKELYLKEIEYLNDSSRYKLITQIYSEIEDLRKPIKPSIDIVDEQ